MIRHKDSATLLVWIDKRKHLLFLCLVGLLLLIMLLDRLFVAGSILPPTAYFYALCFSLALLYGVLPLYINRRLTAYYWERTQRNRLAIFGVAFISFLVVVAIFGPLFTQDPTTVNFEEKNLPPVGFPNEQSVYDLNSGQFTTTTTPGTWKHPLGTDDKGRDMLAMLVSGARVSLQVGLLATGIAIALGIIMGVSSAYFGGAIDNILMRFTDIMMTFPFFLLLVFIVYVFGPQLMLIIIMIGLTGWTGTARLVRSECLSLRTREFVLASKSLGASDARIIFRHLVPNTASSIIVIATLSVPGVILAEAALSFIGLGDPTVASWGVILNAGQRTLDTAWWVAVEPGIMLFFTVLAFNFLGDGLRDAFDPRSTESYKAKDAEVLLTRELASTPVVLSNQEATNNTTLKVNNLKTYFFTQKGVVQAGDGVSLELRRSECLCLVGESGCGKTVTALSILRLIDPPGRTIAGEIRFHQEDLRTCSEARMRAIRGNRIAMIFQDPQSSLNPVLTVGEQLMEPIRLHLKLKGKAAEAKALSLMQQIGIPSASTRLHEYPHQFSGGMKQRVMIAMALSCEPEILIADEPTTALDVTIKAQILDIFKELVQKRQTSIIFITHDLGTVAEIADRIIVMYGGKIAEVGRAEDIFDTPKHPYTIGLLNCLPDASETKPRLTPIPGTIPSLINPPGGCIFHPRCEHVMEICRQQIPPEIALSQEHRVVCHLYSQVALAKS